MKNVYLWIGMILIFVSCQTGEDSSKVGISASKDPHVNQAPTQDSDGSHGPNTEDDSENPGSQGSGEESEVPDSQNSKDDSEVLGSPSSEDDSKDTRSQNDEDDSEDVSSQSTGDNSHVSDTQNQEDESEDAGSQNSSDASKVSDSQKSEDKSEEILADGNPLSTGRELKPSGDNGQGKKNKLGGGITRLTQRMDLGEISNQEIPGDGEVKKLALLVGVNDYLNLPNLNGSVNDIDILQQVLLFKFGFPETGITRLVDEEATKDRILQELQNLIDQATKKTIVLFHFSGHGFQINDESGDEIDRLDEALAPYDANGDSTSLISDDEIGVLSDKIRAKSHSFIAIVDNCFSSTATQTVVKNENPWRDSLRNNAPREPNAPLTLSGPSISSDPLTPSMSSASSAPHSPLAPSSPLGPSGLGPSASSALSSDRKTLSPSVVIAATGSYEVAGETSVDGKSYGLLTYSLVKTLYQVSPKSTWSDIQWSVEKMVESYAGSQKPQIYGNSDLVIFDYHTLKLKANFRVIEASGDIIKINCGSVHGLAEGSVFEFYAPDDRKRKGPGLVKGMVFQVNSFDADIKLDEHSEIPMGAIAIKRMAGKMAITMNLAFENEAESGLLEEHQKKWKLIPGLKIVKNPEEADLLIKLSGNQKMMHFKDQKGRPMGGPVKTDHVSQQEVVIGGWVNWFKAYKIKSAEGIRPEVDLQIRSESSSSESKFGKDEPLVFKDGEALTLTVTYQSDYEFYVSILGLSSCGEIIEIFPTDKGQQPLVRDNKLEVKGLKFSLHEGFEEENIRLKVFLTVERTSFAPFLQSELGHFGEGPETLGALGRVNTRPTRYSVHEKDIKIIKKVRKLGGL